MAEHTPNGSGFEKVGIIHQRNQKSESAFFYAQVKVTLNVLHRYRRHRVRKIVKGQEQGLR